LNKVFLCFLFVLCLIPFGYTIKDEKFPLPFTRHLKVGSVGKDVLILHEFLKRVPFLPPNLNFKNDTLFDRYTSSIVNMYQMLSKDHLNNTGELDSDTAKSLLNRYSQDGYKPVFCVKLGSLPGQYKYLVDIPIYANRSIETIATLYDSECNALLNFKVRTHGQKDFNEFSDSGNTPTGLSTFDLNSPEPDPKSYGPYNVNRAVKGILGNARFLIPNIRNGILMHTGEWDNWDTSKPMPDSHGCIHGWPEDIKKVSDILVNQLNVQVRENPFGKLPYPYKPQGLLSIWIMQNP
jgi:hypothetical protein